MTTAKIEIAFQSFWFVGTGREAGVYADSIPVKRNLVPDADNPVMVPCVPGKTVKGMFRDAFVTAGNNGWFSDIGDAGLLEKALFGQSGPDKYHEQSPDSGKDNENTAGRSGKPGMLHFSTLEIRPEVGSYLKENSAAACELFRTVKSTAIDEKTGTAKDKSLREYEVVVPLTLTGTISFCDDEIKSLGFAGGDDLTERLNQVAALITELGGKRTRGFGQCVTTVTKETER